MAEFNAQFRFGGIGLDMYLFGVVFAAFVILATLHILRHPALLQSSPFMRTLFDDSLPEGKKRRFVRSMVVMSLFIIARDHDFLGPAARMFV
jgi:hypothetical protein